MARSKSKKRKRERKTKTQEISGGNRSKEAAAAAAAADHISSLPDCVLASILSLIPLQESVRTSVLSSRWRHLWTLAAIRIDMGAGDDCSEETSRSRLKAVVDILRRHRGPIRSFRLEPSLWSHLLVSRRNSDLLDAPYQSWPWFDRTLDSWLQTLAQCGIRDLSLCYKLHPRVLTLESLRSLELVAIDHPEQITSLPPNLTELKLGSFGSQPRQLGMRHQTKLPPAFLACPSLSSLELHSYAFEKPLEVPLPPSLRELTLQDVKVKGFVLSQVLSECPFLEALCLDIGTYLDDVHICSPSLRKLMLKNPFTYCLKGNVMIVDAPNLEFLMFNDHVMEHMKVKVVSAPKLQGLGIVNAHVRQTCLQDGILAGFGACLYSIKSLAIKVQSDDTQQGKRVVGLLKCLPSLENLDITLWSASGRPLKPKDEEYWEKEASSNCLDNHLKVISVIGFARRPSHLCLVRFLVRTALLLKVIYLFCYFEVDKSWQENVKHELLPNNRASSDLRVIAERYSLNTTKLSTWKSCLN